MTSREAVIQKAAASIKSTINKDAAAKQLGQELLTAVNIAMNKEYHAKIDDQAAVAAGVPQATGKEYRENFVALGYKVMDDILNDTRFQNVDKMFLASVINIAAENSMLTENGDLGAFRQGEDRAINNAKVGAAKTANIHSKPSAQPTASQTDWISISRALVVIALALGILVALVVW